MLLAFLAGGVAGALIAHSMYGVIFLGIVLGPVAAVHIARRVEHRTVPVVLAYAVGLGLGMSLLADGVTMKPGEWRFPLSAAIFTGIAGVVAALLAGGSDE